jgi:hypothetical protein
MMCKHKHKTPSTLLTLTQYSSSGTLQKHNFTPMDAMTDCVFLNMFSFTTKTISKSNFHPEEGDR